MKQTLLKILKYTLLTLLWGGVGAYVVYASLMVRQQRALQTVKSLSIAIVDSQSQGRLVSSPMVRGWIKNSGIRTIGAHTNQVDLAGLERMIARNGFVDHVEAYVSYVGDLRIEISQRRPCLRLLTDSVDFYVTAEGFVFQTPPFSALYMPVVTGSYQPPFPSAYTGSIQQCLNNEIRRTHERIAEIEKQKYPFYKRERENEKLRLKIRRMRVKPQWFESSLAFDKRSAETRLKREQLRKKYRYEAQRVQAEIDRISELQQQERLKQKKFEKSCEDFSKLIIFVEFVEKNDFWRSEVVQIVATTTASGALDLTLIPRSGNHAILFGEIENAEAVQCKFDKLLHFYRNGFNKFGWEEYRTINVKYKDQVVCKK
ncbi:MAG: hypothetical protein RSB23_06420 [Alistipes sp.]